MTVLACDLGGTRTKLGIVRDGQVMAQSIVPSNSKQGLAPLLPIIKSEWLRLLGEAGLTLINCKGVGVSFPSLIDHATGRILDSYGKFEDAMAIDLRAWSRSELGLPLAIENDARMACIGEWQHGAGRGTGNLVMVTLGTGLGTCVIMEGHVLRGVHGQAGVLGGHLTVSYGGRVCACGNIGCAEAEASSFSLVALANAHPGFASSPLANEPLIDFASVFRHACAGDPCAIALRDHNLLVWSSLAVNLVHSYDPELLIFGGGIMASAAVILPAVRDYVGQHAHTPWGQVRVEASALGDQSALVAAEWLLNEQSIHL